MNRTSNVPKNENGLILMGVRGRGGGREGGLVFPMGFCSSATIESRRRVKRR